MIDATGWARKLLARGKGAVTGPHVHGIHHTGLTVSDFEASVSWWADHFGFLLVTELTIEGEDAQALAGLYGAPDLTVRLGFMRAPDGNILEIFTFDPPIPPERTDWRRPGYTHLALAVRDVPGWVKRLKAKGLQFETDVRFTAGAHWAFFRDPDDNLIELIDLHANRIPLKFVGGLIGRGYRRGKWAGYYL